MEAPGPSAFAALVATREDRTFRLLSSEEHITVVPWYLWGVGSRIPKDTKIWGCSNPLYKMVKYLHVNHAHPPASFKPSLDYLQYLTRTKCCVHSC